MTRENKDLLLKDLCSRLPYGVMVDYENHIYVINEIDPACKDIDYITVRIQDAERLMCAKSVIIEDIKPYLRPMYSMTEEEKEELEHLSEEYFGKALDKQIQESLSSSNRNESEILEYIASSIIVDWLNAHHFDYRLLIEKGLALEAPEWIYK